MVAMVVAIRLFMIKNMVRYPTSSQKGWDSQIVLVWLPFVHESSSTSYIPICSLLVVSKVSIKRY